MTKTWSWAICGYDLVQYPLERIIEICQVAGFSGIEWAPPLFEHLGDAELAEATGAIWDAGLRIDTFHLPFAREDDIADFYETGRRAAVLNMRRWMERAAAVGAKYVIQHPSRNHNDCRVEDVTNYLRQFGKSIGELLPTAKDLDLTVAVENMASPGRHCFASIPEHFHEIIREFTDPNLGFTFDTGHALISPGLDRYDEYYDLLGPRVVCYHLADNGGNRDSHLPPGHGHVPWGSFFRKAAELEFARGMCIETPPLAPGPDYSVEAWAQMVRDTEKLVASALA